MGSCAHIVREVKDWAGKVDTPGFAHTCMQGSDGRRIGPVLRSVGDRGRDILEAPSLPAGVDVVEPCDVPPGAGMVLSDENAAWRDLEDDRESLASRRNTASVASEDGHVALVPCRNEVNLWTAAAGREERYEEG